MGRMLEALQQVSGEKDGGETLHPLSREELAAFGLRHLTEPTSLRTPQSDAGQPPVEPPAPTPPAPPSTVFNPVNRESGRKASGTTFEECEAAASELDRLLGTAVRERQYGDLADALLARIPPGRPTALLLTPVGELEEIAAIAADLSVAVSRRASGEVIVVDADSQNHGLDYRLGSESGRSLQEVLSGVVDWREVVRPTRMPRLSLLPGGDARSRMYLSGATYIGHLLDELRRHYSLILLQTGPVGRPEVGALARQSDATYLMVPLGRVRRRQIRRAASVLKRSGAAPSGVVVIG